MAYDQQELENCFTFATLAPAQTTVEVNQTIFDDDDVVVYRDEEVCTLATIPSAVDEYRLVYAAGIQGIQVIFGAGAAGGEEVVIERDIDAYRMSQFNVAGPVPAVGINDQINFIIAAIQSAARWQEDGSGVIRATPGANIGTLTPVPNSVIGFDEDGNLTTFPIEDLINQIPPIGTQTLIDMIISIFQEGDDVTIVDNGDGTITIDVDLGGDLLLLEGDQQSGAGGGGSDPTPGVTIEDVMDFLATHLIPGTNMTSIVYDDAASGGEGTITFNASGGTGITTEQAMDAVATMLLETGALSAVYDDASDSYTLTVAQSGLKPPMAMLVRVCPDATAVTSTMTKTIRAPFGCTISGVRASLKTAQTGGGKVTFDITEAGASIFGANKLTIDNGAKTSVGASVAPDLNDTAIADDAELVISCSAVGDGTAKGAVVCVLFSRT